MKFLIKTYTQDSRIDLYISSLNSHIMKKIFALIFALVVCTTYSFAQTKTTTQKEPTKTVAKKKVAATKKDGSPDMRYKENKDKKAATKPAVPLKKDGTPDKRYKENKKA